MLEATIIEFRDVHKWFGKLHVLRGINLEISRGQVVVVCGPSGSGKSTLIRCINRLEPIQKGEIIVNGTSVHLPDTNITKLRADIGMVFQSFNLYPHMTALENVSLAPRKARRMPREEAGRLGLQLLQRQSTIIACAKA
jgi:polar amino acid transport system ATP-binding protein|tara:strand:- start:124 stop:540 length:417 start_codon:yes stop_codon:yes gene_type:complete